MNIILSVIHYYHIIEDCEHFTICHKSLSYYPGLNIIISVIHHYHIIQDCEHYTTGCPTKHYPRRFCLISLATNRLEGWDIFHLKGRIHSFVWSTKKFLYDIRELRYKKIKIGYQICQNYIVCKKNQQFHGFMKCLAIINMIIILLHFIKP